MGNKIIMVFLITIFVSCKASKKSIENHIAYEKYLVSRNIDPIKANDLEYYYDFYALKKKKKSLLVNPYLKVNKVYVYQRSASHFTFCIYSEYGNVYCSDYEDNEGHYFTEDKITINIKPSIDIKFIGTYEVDKDTIKIERFINTAFQKWNEVDQGIIRNDTISLNTSYVSTKDYRYKKKWLAKIKKTNFEFIYNTNF